MPLRNYLQFQCVMGFSGQTDYKG